MVLRNTDIKFLTTFTLLLGFLSSDKNLIYARAYRDYDNYNYGSLNLMSDYGNQELGSRGYYQASAYDRSISKAQNHQLNNINLEMENCDSMPFHEPLICRAARCAIDTATIRKILAQPSQKKQLNEIADYYQMTPLHVSAAYQTNNPYPIVKELITMGANISSTGSLDNRTPVIETGTNKYGGVEAIRALLEDYTPYRRLIQHHARIKDLSMEKKAILRETYSKKEVEKVLSPRSNDDQLEISISSFSDGNDDQEEDPVYVKVVIKGKRTRDPTDHYFKQKALLLATDDMQENVYHVATKNENINLLEYLIEKFPEISEQGLAASNNEHLIPFQIAFQNLNNRDLMQLLIKHTPFDQITFRALCYTYIDFRYIPELLTGILFSILILIVLKYTGFFKSSLMRDTYSEKRALMSSSNGTSLSGGSNTITMGDSLSQVTYNPKQIIGTPNSMKNSHPIPNPRSLGRNDIAPVVFDPNYGNGTSSSSCNNYEYDDPQGSSSYDYPKPAARGRRENVHYLSQQRRDLDH